MSGSDDNDSTHGAGISSLNPTARSEERLMPGRTSDSEPDPSKAGHIRHRRYLSQHEDDSQDQSAQVDSLNPYVRMRSLTDKNLSELFSSFDTNSPRIGLTRTRLIQRSTSQDPATQLGSDVSKRVHIGGHRTCDDGHELSHGFDYCHTDNMLHPVEHLTEALTPSRNDLPCAP